MKFWKAKSHRNINGVPVLFYFNSTEYINLHIPLWMYIYGDLSSDLHNNVNVPLFICRNVPPMDIIDIQLIEYSAWSPKK